MSRPDGPTEPDRYAEACRAAATNQGLDPATEAGSPIDDWFHVDPLAPPCFLRHGAHGVAVLGNCDLGLDLRARPGDPLVGEIEERFGLGWGIYPPTEEGLALARLDAEEFDRSVVAMFDGDWPVGIDRAEVLAVDSEGLPYGGPNGGNLR